jgi:hypothetical protein
MSDKLYLELDEELKNLEASHAEPEEPQNLGTEADT